MPKFEDVLERIGEFGPFQIRVYILVSMFETPCSWAIMLPIFSSAMPEFRCPAIGEVFGGDGERSGIRSGSMYTTATSYRNQSDRSCTAMDEVCGEIEYTSEFSSVISEWNLLCNKEYVASLITTIQMAGVFVGASATGQLGDTFGRKQMLYPNYSLMLLAGFLSSFANTWQLYAACRFFVGVFYSGTLQQSMILPIEFVGSKWRTLCGTFGCFTFGSMTLAGLAYFIRDWRHLTIVTTVGGIFLLFSWWFVPESPRWLIKKGRLREAKEVLICAAKFNGRPNPDLCDLQAIHEENEKEHQSQKLYTYLDLFRNWKMVKYTFISMYCWFTVSVAYYGITFNLSNLSGNMYLNVFLSASLELLPVIFLIAFSNRIGRRRMTRLLLLTGGLSCLGIIILDLAGEMESMPWLTNGFAFVGKLGAGGAWDSIGMVSVELFPTVVRNVGIGISFVSARFAGVLAPQLVLLAGYYKATPYLVAGVLSLIGVFLLLLIPETANKPLWEELPPRTLCLCSASGEKGETPLTEGDKGIELSDICTTETPMCKHSSGENVA